MQRRPFVAGLALALVCLLALWAGRAEAGFVVIRNAKNATAKLDKNAVKGVFSGKTKTWGSGVSDDTDDAGPRLHALDRTGVVVRRQWMHDVALEHVLLDLRQKRLRRDAE